MRPLSPRPVCTTRARGGCRRSSTSCLCPGSRRARSSSPRRTRRPCGGRPATQPRPRPRPRPPPRSVRRRRPRRPPRRPPRPSRRPRPPRPRRAGGRPGGRRRPGAGFGAPGELPPPVADLEQLRPGDDHHGDQRLRAHRGQAQAANFMKPNANDKNVRPDEMVAYVRSVGLQADWRVGGDLDRLKLLLANGIPVVVESGSRPDPNDWMGHYRLLVGYDDAAGRFIAYDSSSRPGMNVRHPVRHVRRRVAGLQPHLHPRLHARAGAGRGGASWGGTRTTRDVGAGPGRRPRRRSAANGNDAVRLVQRGRQPGRPGPHAARRCRPSTGRGRCGSPGGCCGTSSSRSRPTWPRAGLKTS